MVDSLFRARLINAERKSQIGSTLMRMGKREPPGPRAIRRREALIFSMIALSMVIWWGCGRPTTSDPVSDQPAGPVWFEDITEKVGLNFVHDPGPVDGKFFMPQIIGSGAALFDFDNDGRLDILLLQNGGPNSTSTNQLLRQGADGNF